MKPWHLSRAGALCFAVVCLFDARASSAQDAQTNVVESVPQRLIVKYKSSGGRSLSAATMRERMTARLSSMAATPFLRMRQLATGAELFRPERKMNKADLEALAARLRKEPDIEYVEPDAWMHPTFTPNDSRYNEQWHYYQSTGGARLPQAWDITTGSGAVVAVLDTGYRPHPDLIDNLIGGYDFISDTAVSVDGNGRDSNATDPGDWYRNSACGPNAPPSRNSSWHGTHVAGTVAAETNNGSGVAGVAFGAKVVPVRVLGRCGGSLSDIADAIIWASGGSVSGVPNNPNPAQVINMSLGGSGSCGSTYQNAINIARANGATVVVSAGNSNTNASNARPANCSGVITVAATDRNGGRSYYSNYGSTVELSAPGGDVRVSGGGVLSTVNAGSTTPGNENAYAFFQGTSMAAPHVAGVAALMYSVDPSLTPNEVASVLEGTARSLPGSCSGGCGAGIVDAYQAVLAVGGGSGGPPSCPAGSTTYTGSVNSSGSYSIEPNGNYYFSSAGTHEGTMFGPSNANFDLRLYRWQGGRWQVVASSVTGSSDESVTYSGSSGYYLWAVWSASGTGNYTFCLDRP